MKKPSSLNAEIASILEASQKSIMQSLQQASVSEQTKREIVHYLRKAVTATRTACELDAMEQTYQALEREYAKEDIRCKRWERQQMAEQL